MRIAVAGGTGLVGRMVVAEAEARGHEPVVLARSRGIDITTGTGLDAALAGADALIDVSNVTTVRRAVSVEFFGRATRNLLWAGELAGVRHHLALSIVGIERVDYGYYEGKREQERLIHEGRVPWTVLRSTQFHEFAELVLSQVPGPLAIVPRQRIKPVAAREVAAKLVALIAEEPRGKVLELGGPEERDLPDLARRIVHARGESRKVLGVPLPGAVGSAMASGELLPGPSAFVGTQTFDQWLLEKFGRL
ncbi:SDR family oxidoreductase [Herbiconiux sp. SYSU D00978]|uniref:SDR family oxidoreductase n=1 Tax=Herbiconiux sp. SYSU D00978 TaxID=2812562 RepID=UPI001A97A6CF|nr:SDR family oxidoreductase [Herbiconiux sp. SYSU D00978]